MERLQEGKYQKERLGKVEKLHVAKAQEAFFKSKVANCGWFIFQNRDFEFSFLSIYFYFYFYYKK